MNLETICRCDLKLNLQFHAPSASSFPPRLVAGTPGSIRRSSGWTCTGTCSTRTPTRRRPSPGTSTTGSHVQGEGRRCRATCGSCGGRCGRSRTSWSSSCRGGICSSESPSTSSSASSPPTTQTSGTEHSRSCSLMAPARS